MDKALQMQQEIKKVFGGAPVELVGGSVRDVLLGKTPKDYDYCTPLLPDEIKEKIQAAGRKAYTIGERFGTIGFKVQTAKKGELADEEGGVYGDEPRYYIKDEFEYVEITTYRSEVYQSKSRKPEVEFITSLDADLARRDFTINAMVLKDNGSIYDPYGGRLDILAKQIKTVGLPKDRIQEDPLRMLRAARFASQLDFGVDPNLIGKMRQLGYTITHVSKERWVMELDKMLMGKNPARGLKVLMQSEVMKYILPEVYLALQDEETYQELATSLDALTDKVTLNERWAMLLFAVGFPYTFKEDKGKVTFVNHEVVRNELLQGVCARLKFSNERRDALLKDKAIFNKKY